jgi:hypothetical protein
MGAAGEFADRVKGYFGSAGRGIGRALRRTGRDVRITIEERPEIGPVELELPYPLPTREDPLALALFYFSAVTIVVMLFSVPAIYIATGQVPPVMAAAVGTMALLTGLVGNLHIVGRFLHEESTPLLRPLVGAGIPLLRAVHFWFGPLVAVLAVLYVAAHPSNNWLMHGAALVLCVWTVTGLLSKLPRDSPWNGRMLRRWTKVLHRRPFVYVVIVAFVAISAVTDFVY